jgi:hypothetical protein
LLTGRIILATDLTIINAAIGNTSLGVWVIMIGAGAGITAKAIAASIAVGKTGVTSCSVLIIASGAVKASIGVTASTTAGHGALAGNAISQHAKIPFTAG